MAALRLALEGVKVLMIEAGRNYEPTKETPMFNTPEMAPLRGERTPERPRLREQLVEQLAIDGRIVSRQTPRHATAQAAELGNCAGAGHSMTS